MTGISPEARACLSAYDWPGNVRELENAIERAVVLGSTDRVLPEDLPETVLDAAPDPFSSDATPPPVTSTTTPCANPSAISSSAPSNSLPAASQRPRASSASTRTTCTG